MIRSTEGYQYVVKVKKLSSPESKQLLKYSLLRKHGLKQKVSGRVVGDLLP